MEAESADQSGPFPGISSITSASSEYGAQRVSECSQSKNVAFSGAALSVLINQKFWKLQCRFWGGCLTLTRWGSCAAATKGIAQWYNQSFSDTPTIIHGLISSWLVYCNDLFNNYQSENSKSTSGVAKGNSQTKKIEHISPALIALHLPLRFYLLSLKPFTAVPVATGARILRAETC